MKITLVGMGGGTFDSVTMQGAEAFHEATLIIGAKRLLENLPDFCTQNRIAMYKIGEILSVLETTKEQNIALIYSGDTGFYSGASALCRVLDERHIEYTVIPGVSSVQLLSVAIHEPWQNWNLVSAHGCACDPVAACSMGKPTFFLTGGEVTPAVICAKLTEAGLGDVQAIVGENLGTPQQKISKNTVRKISENVFAPLCVLLVESCEVPVRRVPGLADEVFIRGKTPMTKQEVRAAALAKLAVKPTDILWDIGAGTGSVSIEMALAAPLGYVYAVECDAAACSLIKQNRDKFHVRNLTLVEGKAPEKLTGLPAPDAVFIGGSKGNLPEIIDAVLTANPSARLCVSAIALETLQTALSSFATHGMTAQITQIAISRSSSVGNLHLMKANNPVFLIVRE